MIINATIRKNIYDVIKKYASNGVNVIWENQAEARPPKPYISLHIIGGPRMIGCDDEVVDPIDSKVFLIGMRELSLSCNFFGENAYAELGRVQESLGLPTAVEMFLKDNIVFVSDTGIKDLSALMENRFESRAQMDLKFRLTNKVKDYDSTVIESVILNNDLDGTTTTIS